MRSLLEKKRLKIQKPLRLNQMSCRQTWRDNKIWRSAHRTKTRLSYYGALFRTSSMTRPQLWKRTLIFRSSWETSMKEKQFQ